MNVHRIDLRPDMRPGGRQWGKTPMLYRGEVIGSSHDPKYAAARWLLDNGMAAPEDRLETYRGETLCMRGIVGKLAKWTVVENKDGDPTFTLPTGSPSQGPVLAHRRPKQLPRYPFRRQKTRRPRNEPKPCPFARWLSQGSRTYHCVF